MPNTKPPATNRAALEAKYARAAEVSRVNYAFYLGATNDNLEDIRTLDPLAAPGIKVFMGASTGNMLVDNPATLDAIFRDTPVPIITSRSPGRTGSWNTIVLSLMIASGRSSFSFRSKCTWSGSACCVRPGAQWWGRNHTDNIVGGAIGPLVISAAASSSQYNGLPFSTDAHVVQM